MKKGLIYADNAATTQLDKAAYEAMIPWLVDYYGNPSQPYLLSRKPRKAITEARDVIANCIGALSDEIYFTSCGTESDNWVIKESAITDPGKHLTITSEFEHHAILHSCASIEKIGYPVTYIRPNSKGYITPKALENVITDNTRLVSVMFANNELGTIQPIRELCTIAHKKKALFHTDAVQAVGHVRINVHELGVDFLSASAHKFNGPKGIGFLYIRKGIDLSPYMDGGAQESGRRAGTENVASIVGMSTALQSNCGEIEKNAIKLRALEEKVLSALNSNQIDYQRNGGDDKLPGVLSLSFPNNQGEAILHRMDLMGICISTGSACDSKNTEVSHVLKAIGLDEKLAQGTVRISLGKNNTLEDAEAIAQALIKIVKE